VPEPSGTRDAAGIEEADAGDGFVSRNMGVTVQEDVAHRRLLGWDMLEVKARSFELEIERQWPSHLTVTVSAHDTNFADALKLQKNYRGAHISEMPNFIRITDPIANTGRQAVMSVGENGDAHATGKEIDSPRPRYCDGGPFGATLRAACCTA
jgi:hypothetical protein